METAFFATCDKCAKPIYYGNEYVTIERNLENAKLNCVSDKIHVDIIDSELILMLCSDCGTIFQHKIIETIIKTIPISSSLGENN